MDQDPRGGWRKSSYSGSSGNCVEVMSAARIVAVRDTKQDAHGSVLQFTVDAWQEFLVETKRAGLTG